MFRPSMRMSVSPISRTLASVRRQPVFSKFRDTSMSEAACLWCGVWDRMQSRNFEFQYFSGSGTSQQGIRRRRLLWLYGTCFCCYHCDILLMSVSGWMVALDVHLWLVFSKVKRSRDSVPSWDPNVILNRIENGPCNVNSNSKSTVLNPYRYELLSYSSGNFFEFYLGISWNTVSNSTYEISEHTMLSLIYMFATLSDIHRPADRHWIFLWDRHSFQHLDGCSFRLDSTSGSLRELSVLWTSKPRVRCVGTIPSYCFLTSY